MKSRRTFQIASGILAILYSLAMLAVAVILCLHVFQHEVPEIFANWGTKITTDVVSKISFIPQDGPWGGVIVIAAMLALPALLLLFGALALLHKSKKGKEGLHNFGGFLGVLGILIFVVLVEMMAIMSSINLFGDDKWTYVIACAVAGILLLFLLILSMYGGKKKQKVAAEQQSNETTETAETAENQVANEQETAPATHETDNVYVVTEPYVNPHENARQDPTPNANNDYGYMTYDSRSVNDIMDRTYGTTPLENVSPQNLKKIQTLQSLYEAKAITKEEYLALVNAYLGGNK